MASRAFLEVINNFEIPEQNENVYVYKHGSSVEEFLEDIEDIQIQSQRGADVIGFAAVDDAFDIVEHKGAKNPHRRHGQHHHQGARRDEEVGNHADKYHQHANK